MSQLVTEFERRDHFVTVLTSNFGVQASDEAEESVLRLLHLENDLNHYQPARFFLGRQRRLRQNLQHVDRAIAEFTPDVVLVGVMWNFSRSIPWLAEQLCPERVVYYVFDHWPYSPDPHTSYWELPARHLVLQPIKKILASMALAVVARDAQETPLRLKHVICVSQAIQSNLVEHACVPIDNTRVVNNGIEIDLFVSKKPSTNWPNEDGEYRLVFVGSLVRHKGVHTAIEALSILKGEKSVPKITLTLVGSGHPEYETSLQELVARKELDDCVCFLGKVDRGEMPLLYRQFWALVFPSIWDEPLARTMQEAMASGLVVIGTTTGGSRELLVEGVTGLTFEPGDSQQLATQIECLIENPSLYKQLSLTARQEVVWRFDIRRTFDESENYLIQVATGSIQ